MKRRGIWWDTEKGKLDGTEEAKRELMKRYVGKDRLTKDEFRFQIQEATYWLADRPGRRSSRSNIKRFLQNWMADKVEKKRSGLLAKGRIDAERGGSRPSPPQRPKPKWCPACRHTLPSHADWCDARKA